MPSPVELLYADPNTVPRIRKQPAFRAILDEAAREPRGPEPSDPVLAGRDLPPEDRADVSCVLARGAPQELSRIAGLVAGAVKEDGQFAPPLVLVEGELTFSLDELETLKASVTTATPFIGGDEALKSAVDAAKELLSTRDLLASPALSETLSERIREAFARTRRAVPPSYLEAQVERALLLQRKVRKRMFGGVPHARAVLEAPGEKASLLVLLPLSAVDLMPLHRTFSARLLAEASPSADQFETHPIVLRVTALARVLPAPGARRP